MSKRDKTKPSMSTAEAGRKRWRGMTAEERAAVARAAANARWEQVRLDQAAAESEPVQEKH
jgi:hypothetical protein